MTIQIPPQRINVYSPEAKHGLQKIMENGQLTQGKYLKRFEHLWSEACEKPHTVAVNSCTSALEIAIRSLNIVKGSKIAVPTNTYGATVQACWNAGYEVELVEIEHDLNMDIEKIDWRENIGAVLMVFIGGNVPERIIELEEICEKESIPLIIDGAHAHGIPSATQHGDVTAFSFHATKLITTFGEGGALVTDRPDIVEYARAYRHHGRASHKMDWIHYMGGSNMCMTEAQAIVGIDQVFKLPTYIENRRKVAKIYDEKFNAIAEPDSNYYKYIVHDNLVVKDDRITLPSPVYRKPIHQHPFWKGYSNFPIANIMCREHNCLPIYNNMSEDEAVFVRDNVEVS